VSRRSNEAVTAALTFAMENTLQAILDSLPPPRRRSKLDPYAALIRALRARGRSYREIVTILRERWA